MTTRLKLALSSQGGFTLIEILIVMVIIGILATLSVGSFRSSQVKSRDGRRKSDLKQIAISLEAYYSDKGEYPDSSGANKIMGCLGGAECDWGAQLIDDKGTVYMVKIPTDPRDNYSYYYSSGGNSFQLYARMENERDPDVPKSGDDYQNYGINCGGAGCNYGISSTNTTPEAGRNLVVE